ncbi:MAG: probable iron-sulfur binding protein YPO1417, partial [uncultured Gemmatimonadetes bacterium]
FGNLAVNPRAGLLFIDFDQGATLQLSGSAEVLWDRADFAAFPGAHRAVRFRVSDVVELPHGTRLHWRLIQRSPFNPPAPE